MFFNEGIKYFITNGHAHFIDTQKYASSYYSEVFIIKIDTELYFDLEGITQYKVDIYHYFGASYITSFDSVNFITSLDKFYLNSFKIYMGYKKEGGRKTR